MSGSTIDVTVPGGSFPGDAPADGVLGGREQAEEVAREAMEASGGLSRIDFGGMSSSQILAFMTAVMKDVDHQLGARADVLRRRNERASELGEDIAVLEQLKLAAEDGKLLVHVDSGHQMITGEHEAKIDGVGVHAFLENSGNADVLEGIDTHDHPDTATGKHYISVDDLESRITALKAEQDALTTNSELDMVGFQSIVQTRQMFVNLATQMMSSQHGAQNNVVQNIGR